MKKLFYILSVLAAAALTSCRNEPSVGRGAAGEGAVAMTFRLPEATRAADTDGYPWKTDCDIRIFKKTEGIGKELIRHYFSTEDLPEQLWLLEGSYAVTVSLGSRAPLSFDRPSYYGEADFVIEAGKRTAVSVSCRLLDTMVEVVFDASVKNTFDESLRVIAMPGETFDDEAAEVGVNALRWTDSGRGYFLLSGAETALSFCLEARSSRDDIREKFGADGLLHKHFTQPIAAGKTEGYLYRLKLKWSPDAEAWIDWEFSLRYDPSEEVLEDFVAVNPAPKPTIEGDAWNIAEPRKVAGDLRYKIACTSSELKSIILECGDERFEADPAAPAENGIRFEADPEKGLRALTMTLEKAFFDRFAGGEHALTLTAVARSEARTSALSTLLLPGALSLTPVDRWQGEGEFRACLYADASEVKIRYRAAQTEAWTEVAAEAADEDGGWKATGGGIAANTRYEYQLLADGVPVGAAPATTTDDGPQIPNADFETWAQQGNAICPYIGGGEQWWDSGNHGSTTLGPSWNITTNENDPRPGSSGTTSAKLSSKYVVVKFAAGNIFLGRYAGTSGTNGVIAFGKPFAYTYRPKALRFWYKATVNGINRGSGAPGVSSGDPDPNEVYIMLCNMGGPHIVNTADNSSLINTGSKTLSYCSDDSYSGNSKNDMTDGHVIASAVWNNTVTQGEWTMVELPLLYNDEYEGEVPTYLLVTASASKYGDYFMGSDSNVLCLDDVELVY